MSLLLPKLHSGRVGCALHDPLLGVPAGVIASEEAVAEGPHEEHRRCVVALNQYLDSAAEHSRDFRRISMALTFLIVASFALLFLPRLVLRLA